MYRRKSSSGDWPIENAPATRAFGNNLGLCPAPVFQSQRIAEGLHPLKVFDVASYQYQRVFDRRGGDHRISPADWLSSPQEISVDLACQFGCRFGKREHLMIREAGQEFR